MFTAYNVNTRFGYTYYAKIRSRKQLLMFKSGIKEMNLVIMNLKNFVLIIK